MKKLLSIIVLGLLLSGCAESGGEVLSSLIYGVALLGLMLLGIIIYPIVKTVSVVTKVLYPKSALAEVLNPEDFPNLTKEDRKKNKNQLVEDKKFIKTRWKKRKWQYPDKRKWQHPTYNDWYKAVQEAKDRIWFADSRNKGPRPRTDKELLFGYNKFAQNFAGEIIEVEKRILRKKEAAKEKKIKLRLKKKKILT